MRLSHSAKEAAALVSNDIDQSIRRIAAKLATDEGAEFASEKHVQEAYRIHILALAQQLGMMPYHPNVNDADA